jgi:hypothetical protein
MLMLSCRAFIRSPLNRPVINTYVFIDVALTIRYTAVQKIQRN